MGGCSLFQAVFHDKKAYFCRYSAVICYCRVSYAQKGDEFEQITPLFVLCTLPQMHLTSSKSLGVCQYSHLSS